MTEMTINKEITIQKTAPIKFLAQINVIKKQSPLDIGSTDLKVMEEVEIIVKIYNQPCKCSESKHAYYYERRKIYFSKTAATTCPWAWDSWKTSNGIA